MNNFAETFPPGEFLREELEARGWSQTELAEIIGRPVRLVNELISGKKTITPETAIQLGDSFGTGAELWMNLESQYQLSKVNFAGSLVARRSKLYGLFPVREMTKRGWIETTKSIEVLEHQFLTFFGIDNLEAEIRFCHAAKKTDPQNAPSMLQLAWLFRARRLSSEMVVTNYTEEKLRSALSRLSVLLSAPEEVRHVPRVLAECGVRFVVVEPIPGSKIDGASFWLNGAQPVVALSLRLDRIDNFWFVLRHELEHVLQRHGQERGYIIDQELGGTDGNQVSEEENIANEAAASFCVSSAELNGFLARVGPFFKEERVLLFAQRLNVHPGIVIGQLHRRLKRSDLFRKHLIKVRQFVTSSACTDGWGVVHTN